MRYITDLQLEDAVRRRIISPAQYDALLGMEPADLPPHMAPGAGILDMVSTAEMAAARDSPRGFTWITIAYYLGAMTVMFAFGWFLLDRWRALGPAGVLTVTSIYLTLFAVTGEYLRRQGYRVAGALVTALAVGMVPLVVWSIQRALGLWPDGRTYPMGPFDAFERSIATSERLNAIIIDVATIGAALLAFRRLRFGFLLAPAAIALALLPRLLIELAIGEQVGRNAEPWTYIATGVALLVVAFAIDRRDTDRADFAYWPYLVGVVVCLIGMFELFDRYHAIRHFVPLVGLLVIFASLTLRRAILLAFGGVLVYAYLSWLAFDLFRSSTMFPIVLATLGLTIILAAVWLQRSYPRLVARVNAGLSDQRPWLPGGYLAPALLIAFALVMMVASIPGDRTYRREMDAEYRRSVREAQEPRPDGERNALPDSSINAGSPP